MKTEFLLVRGHINGNFTFNRNHVNFLKIQNLKFEKQYCICMLDMSCVFPPSSLNSFQDKNKRANVTCRGWKSTRAVCAWSPRHPPYSTECIVVCDVTGTEVPQPYCHPLLPHMRVSKMHSIVM